MAKNLWWQHLAGGARHHEKRNRPIPLDMQVLLLFLSTKQEQVSLSHNSLEIQLKH
nr:hypothetical protein [Ectobacillus panaciterrae]